MFLDAHLILISYHYIIEGSPPLGRPLYIWTIPIQVQEISVGLYWCQFYLAMKPCFPGYYFNAP